jgi:hypothetical protein
VGRPNKYFSNVEPHLVEISQMALSMTEEQIAKTLGVSYSSFREMKKKYPALSDSLKKGRTHLVMELKSTLIKKAKGFAYTEKKTIIEGGTIVREEIYQRSSLPDVAALNLLLKNYDSENWANDPQTLKIRQGELELQRKKFEEGKWD